MRALRLLTLFALTPALTLAGEIFGTLTMNGRPVPGASIEIAKGRSVHKSTADRYGAYRVYVPEKGACTVTVFIDPQHPSNAVTIHSFERSVRYDLVLEAANGNYILKTR